MHPFDFKMLPWNVVFGAGSLASLPARMDELGLERALVLSTPEQRGDAERVARLLGARAAGLFSAARMHVPVEVARAAEETARACDAACTVAIGGGSTTGLGKALALHADLPLVAIPTTYAGSEMTNIWGLTEDGRKRTGRSLAVLPRLTIYDAQLSLGLPPAIAGPSALNALAQAIVNAYDRRTNPVLMNIALEAIAAIAQALPTVMAAPRDLEARERLLFGAALAGATLGAGVTSLHHRLCHTLGGSCNTPHAETHAVLLPYTMAFNAPAVPDLMARIAAALGCADAAAGIHDFSTRLGLPTSLTMLGIGADDLPRIAALATESAVVNPREVTREGVLELLHKAWRGARPE